MTATETVGGLSLDTQAMMAFESQKKSAGVAYLLWFFTGGFGGHRFYLGRAGSAVAQLFLSLLGWPLVIAGGFGFLLLVPLGVWLLIDLFTLGGMVSDHTAQIMVRLNAASVRPVAAVSAVDELAKFAALRDQGAISDEEYSEQKARLIGTTSPSPTPPAAAEA